jgi:hypothetical protein
VTVTMTLPAPSDGIGQRHRFVAIGFGWVGLTATKALKHSQLNIVDALVFLTRMTAQGTSHLVSQTSHWASLIPASATVAAVSLLIRLSVTVAGAIAKVVISHDNPRWTLRSGEAGRFAICHIAFRRSRPITKGWL